MNPIFADAVYWIAINAPGDSLYQKAIAVSQRFLSRPIVTSEMVLAELLDGAADRGTATRREAARFVRLLPTLKNVTIVPQTPELFDEALTSMSRDPINNGTSRIVPPA